MQFEGQLTKKTFSLHAKVAELEKIKVGAVSYLNTKPLLYGIEHDATLMQMVELTVGHPADIASRLQQGSIDVGLVPVAIIPSLPGAEVVSAYCIAADGEVASVGLFSEVPLEKMERVLLDYQSRTSVALCKLLLEQYWKIQVETVPAGEDFIAEIKGTTAGVIIGDRALQQKAVSPFMYDLAGAWKAFTGLPFVFAAWVANKPLPENFIRLFNAANAAGLEHLDDVIAANPFAPYDLNTYYRNNISYLLDDGKRQGMALFLAMLADQKK